MADRESQMVVIEGDASGKPTVWCDPEIADLVRALNAGGIRTVASCSGHGHRPGNIVLADGRELFIAKDFSEARQVDAAFPVDINGDRVAVGVDVSDEMVFRMSCWMAAEDGEDDPHHLIWQGNPPEPFGEVWQTYEGQARKALTAALRTGGGADHV